MGDLRANERHAAETILDRPYADPDDDAAVVARAALRLSKALELAIAHDTQPYPTAWAYEQACKARDAARRENELLRAAVAEGDRRLDAAYQRIHPLMDGYCPACGGGCLLGFVETPARAALKAATTDPRLA